jgi:hypothetical protein
MRCLVILAAAPPGVVLNLTEQITNVLENIMGVLIIFIWIRLAV